jgi:hypothetical protein
MIVAITREHCRVEDADDCARLHVTAEELDDDEAGAALQRADLGRAGDAAHVWLTIDSLRTAAREAASIPDWDDRFDAMIAYARSKGWLDACGERVTAHVQRSAS